jgi:hypothetical protein
LIVSLPTYQLRHDHVCSRRGAEYPSRRGTSLIVSNRRVRTDFTGCGVSRKHERHLASGGRLLALAEHLDYEWLGERLPHGPYLLVTGDLGQRDVLAPISRLGE